MDKEEKRLEEKCCMLARRKGLAAVKLEKNGHKVFFEVVVGFYNIF